MKIKRATLYIPVNSQFRLAVYPSPATGFHTEEFNGGDWMVSNDDDAPKAPTDEQIVAHLRHWSERLAALAARYESAVPA